MEKERESKRERERRRKKESQREREIERERETDDLEDTVSCNYRSRRQEDIRQFRSYLDVRYLIVTARNHNKTNYQL
jgi:hypothetical protein